MRDKVLFSNRGIAQEIPRALNELGFVVDILNYDNTSWLPSRAYDLFIGHAGINFESISRQLARTTVRLYFSTGIYWREFNIREARRLYELVLRRGFLLPPERTIRHSEEQANRLADGIICLGNELAASTYAQFRNVVPINNATYSVTWNGWQTKDCERGRTHFLFFSGRGNVHKGLDRLLEVFAPLKDLHLYVCQHIDPEFMRVYRSELLDQKNIHLLGYVKMRSPEFERLAALCNWVILPTCAEGQPGSVIECMAHGLIPILPDVAHVDIEDWGIRLPDVDLETIRSVIVQASEMPVEQYRLRAQRVVEMTKETYSVESFRASFKEAVLKILAAAGSDYTL